MKRLQILGFWLVLEFISTTQENGTNINQATSKLILLPTGSVSSSLDKQTVLVHKPSSVALEERSTKAANKQSSEISKSYFFTAQRTRTPSVRNLYNGTQTTSARNIFTNTQTLSVGIQTISTTENMLIVQPNRTYTSSRNTKTYKLNSSTVGLQNSTIKVTGSSVRYTTGDRFSSANVSKTTSRKSSIVRTSVLQSSIKSESRNVIPYSSTVKSQNELASSRGSNTLQSSSIYQLILSTTQTSQPSIINVSMSRPSLISETENLKVSTTSYVNNSLRTSFKSSDISPQNSTLESFKASRTLDTAYITSTTYWGSEISQFSRHGNTSYQTHSMYLSSRTTANKDSKIKATKVLTIFASVSQASANKESLNTQRQTSSQKIILESLSSSKISLSATDSLVSDIKSSVPETKDLNEHSTIISSSKVYKSQEILSKCRSLPTTTKSHPGGRSVGMPLYVLAIGLPLAALLGFVLACVYFKRNKEDQRARYSVTVEVSAENPGQELKRMYSIIDMSAGITKDFLSGLESRKASNEILDQLDNVPSSVEPSVEQHNQDQNV